MSVSNTGSKLLVSFVAAVPLLVCFRDNMFSLCKVQGSSMEPTLQNGDILLIRKADFPIMGRVMMACNNSNKTHDNNDNDNDVNDDKLEEETKKRRLRENEFQRFAARENQAVWVRWPPSPMRGQIITYKSPDAYPPDLVIKRVIGLAGQVVSDDERYTVIDSYIYSFAQGDIIICFSSLSVRLTYSCHALLLVLRRLKQRTA
jgi:signal peptidase I